VHTYDHVSGHGTVDYRDGYSPRAEVISTYDPIARFEEGLNR
jgi:hypothetical protein